MKTKLFWGLVWSVWCLLVPTASAQNPYLGGVGDGYAKADFTAVSINIFSGGNADGYDRNTVAMLGDTAAFRGGVEDGYTKTQTAMLGDSAAFHGGFEDGYAKNKAAMLGDSAAFRGGVEDGYAKAQGGQTSALTLTASTANALCVGGTGSLTANATLGATPYLYNINNGTNQTSPTFLNLATGAYTLIVTDALGFTATTIVNISAPTTGISFTTTATQPCPSANNGSITIVATDGTAPYTYNIGGANQTSPTFNNAPAATYTIRVTDANGCSTTQLIALTALPATTLTLTNTVSPTCNGDSNGSFSLAANGGVAPYAYNIGGADQSSPTFNNLMAGTYTVNVTDANGCTQTITLNLSQPAPLVSSYSANIPCGGDSLTFTLPISGGTLPYTGGGVRRLPAGTYNFPISDANGCTATATVVLTTAPRLFVQANVTPLTCLTQTTNVTLSAIGGTPPYQGATNIVSGAGTFTFTISDNAGCVADTTLTIVRTGANPTANFSYTINNGAVVFTNTSAGITENTWNFGDASAGSTTTNPTHTYTANGVYTVTLTTQNYCGTSSTTQQVTILITAIAPNTSQEGTFARVFPNPTNGIINVQARLAQAETLTITLSDVLGRTIVVQNLAKNDSFDHKIDVLSLASGVYWIVLATETKRQVMKVVKE